MWTDEDKLYFINKCNLTKTHYLLHERAYNFYRKWDIFFQLQLIILSAIVSMIIFLKNNNLTVFSGILALYNTILSSLFKYFKISQLTEQHLYNSKSMHRLYEIIQTQLDLNDINRDDPTIFRKYIDNKLSRYIETAPTISIYKKTSLNFDDFTFTSNRRTNYPNAHASTNSPDLQHEVLSNSSNNTIVIHT